MLTVAKNKKAVPYTGLNILGPGDVNQDSGYKTPVPHRHIKDHTWLPASSACSSLLKETQSRKGEPLMKCLRTKVENNPDKTAS